MNVESAKATVVEAVATAKADPRYTMAKDAMTKYAKPAAQAVGISAGIGACIGITFGVASAIASAIS